MQTHGAQNHDLVFKSTSMIFATKKKLASFTVALGLVLGAAPQAQAAILFFTDQATFTAAQSSAGNTLLGTETFEQSTAAPGSIVALNDPLQQGVANGPFLTGLTQPITIQSNTNGGNAATRSPLGAGGLAAAAAGNSTGVTSDSIFVEDPANSLDLILTSAPQLGGVSFNPLNSNAFGGAGAGNTLQVQVFDLNEVLLGTTNVIANPMGTNFFGVQVTDTNTIGRINLFNLSSSVESAGVDNVSLFQAVVTPVPEPSTYAMFAIGLLTLVAIQRRKRKSQSLELACNSAVA